ncbi:ABC transporter permease, partial [Agromyces humi]|uniref:ABC transporter permease n=1 Tax=Agromyces humi TaxID=1766800 RepID=UPI00135A75AB
MTTTTPTASGAATPSALVRPRIRALTAEATFIGRSLRHSIRDVEAATMAIVLPVMLMLLFTYIFGNAIDPSGGYVDYVVPGIILLCAGFGSASTAVSVANDMTTGIIDRFRTMPLRSGAVLTGHVVASLARNLVATAVVPDITFELAKNNEDMYLFSPYDVEKVYGKPFGDVPISENYR